MGSIKWLFVCDAERKKVAVLCFANPSHFTNLRRNRIMKFKLDGAGAGKHASRLPIEALGLCTLTSEIADAVVSEDIRWTQADRKQSVESRHDRISTVAYYLSEARGF